MPQHPLEEGRDPKRHQYYRPREGKTWQLAIFGSRAPRILVEKLCGPQGSYGDTPQDELRSERDRRDSPRRGQLSLGPYSQGPVSFCFLESGLKNKSFFSNRSQIGFSKDSLIKQGASRNSRILHQPDPRRPPFKRYLLHVDHTLNQPRPPPAGCALDPSLAARSSDPPQAGCTERSLSLSVHRGTRALAKAQPPTPANPRAANSAP